MKQVERIVIKEWFTQEDGKICRNLELENGEILRFWTPLKELPYAERESDPRKKV